MRSNRRISRSTTSTFSRSGEPGGIFFFWINRAALTAVSGFRISWATPAASRAEGGEFLAALGEGFAFHQFDAQRCDHVPINHDRKGDAAKKHQAQQAED